MKYSDLPHGNSALAIFPSVAGFGWMLFDGPLAPVDWGVSTIARKAAGTEAKNNRSLRRIDHIMRRYQPAVVVLEAFEGRGTRRHARIKRLHRSIIALAVTSGIPVRMLSRDQIQSSFTSADATTRYDVARIVASYVKEVRRLLPNKRKLWESEHPRTALFNATALLIVHYSNPKEPL